MKHLKSIALTTLLTAGLATHAAAGLISVAGGSSLAVVASNDLLSGSYNVGGNVFLDSQADLTFTYLGHEAGYSNTFGVGSDVLHNKNNAVGDSFAADDVVAGLLGFYFYSETIGSGIANGGNQPYLSFQSFAIMTDYTFNGVLYDAVLAFDDSGAGPDDNHDDMIIGIQAAAASVPEPGSLALMGLGLAGLGLRRKAVK